MLDLFVMSFGGLEVSAFAYFGNMLELAPFSEFLVDKQAEEVCKLVDSVSYKPCLRANGTVQTGFYWLVAATIFWILSYILRINNYNSVR